MHMQNISKGLHAPLMLTPSVVTLASWNLLMLFLSR